MGRWILAALLLRLVVLGLALATRPELFFGHAEQAARFADSDRPWMSPFGFEAASVAHAWVVRGQPFADPFGTVTGPTAWVAPGLVLLYTALFAVFGPFSSGAVLGLFGVLLAASAALVALSAHLAGRLFQSPHAPRWAALAAAFAPHDLALYRSAHGIDFNLGVLALLALLALLLALERADLPSRRWGFALGLSGLALCFPTLLLPAALGLAVIARGWPWRRILATVGCVFATLALTLGAYGLWQQGRLGGWVLVKSNLAFELALGNRPEVAGALAPRDYARFHPNQSVAELARYRALGELRYVRETAHRELARIDAGEVLAASLGRARRLFFGFVPEGGEAVGWASLPKRALALLPGLALSVWLLYRRLRLRRLEGLLVAVTVGYALPYMATFATGRYALPLSSIALLVVAGIVSELRRAPA